MADEIKFSEFIDKKDVEKGIKSILNLLCEVDDKLKDMSERSKDALDIDTKDSFKGAKKLNEEIEKTNKIFDKKVEIDKQILKLQQKLKIANSDRVQDAVELQVLNQEQNKINKELAKENLGLVSVYQKQSKALNELRKRYKDVALTQGRNSKAAKELRKELQELDETLKEVDADSGQFQRNVGNYPQVAGAAKRGFGSLSGFLLGAFSASFQKSRDTARELAGGIERVTNVVRVLAIAIVSFAKDRAIPTVQNAFFNLQIGALNLKKSFLELKDFFTSGVEADKVEEDIAKLNEKIAENQKLIDESVDSFENLGEKIGETDDNIEKRLKLQDELINKTVILTDQIQKLSNEEAILESKIGNSTFSFAQRRVQIEELIAIQEKRAGLEAVLARAELENALISIKNDLIRRDLGGQISDQQIKNFSFLKNQAAADAVGLDNLLKLQEATSKLNDIEGQRRLNQIEANKERLENARDEFEQELDFTLDIGDRQKSVNERQIQSDKEVLANRVKILADTKALLEDSFNEQIDLTEGFVKESLKINEGLTDEEAQQKINDLNLEKLVQLEDEKEIRKGLRDAGISDEITQNRIREIIIERKAAIQDVKDAQDDLNEAVNEEADLQLELSAQQEALGKQSVGNAVENNEALEALEEERLANQKVSLRRRIAQSKEGSLEQLRLQKELNDLLLTEQEKANQKILDKEAEALAKRTELTATAIEILSDLSASASEERLKNLDKQIEASSERISQLQEKAKEGQLQNEESVAIERKRQEELEKQRREEEKRQERAQAFFTVVSTFNAKVASGDENPLASTIKDITVLKALSKSFGSAFDGVDDTGGRGNIDSKGGKLWTLHPNEQVWSKKDRESVGFRTRDEVKDIVNMYDSGMLQDLYRNDKASEMFNPSAFMLNGMVDRKMLSKLDELNSNVKGIDIPEGTVDINEVKKLITVITKKGNKITRETSKLRI